MGGVVWVGVRWRMVGVKSGVGGVVGLALLHMVGV